MYIYNVGIIKMSFSYKHSGMLGDLIYSLPIVKHLGGGNFYLHLAQAEWIGKYYYKSTINPFHAGRMNLQDFNFMKDFMLSQDYITSFEILDLKKHEITHNLDRFRPFFIGHPGNYVDIYAETFGITDDQTKENLRNSAWLTVPENIYMADRDVAINRSGRWVPETTSWLWKQWREEGIEERSFFVGLPEEHEKFCKEIGWIIPHRPVNTLLEMAQLIMGSKVFIGNQSVALSLAIGLGHQDIWCEGRRDLPIEKNECYFPERTGIHYF